MVVPQFSLAAVRTRMLPCVGAARQGVKIYEDTDTPCARTEDEGSDGGPGVGIDLRDMSKGSVCAVCGTESKVTDREAYRRALVV